LIKSTNKTRRRKRKWLRRKRRRRSYVKGKSKE